MYLTFDEAREIREAFERDAVASGFGWSRRSYAPMHHLPRLHAALRAAHPGYAIAFDVVFESGSGAMVDWHVDWESLGPWSIPDAWAAIRDSHFRSVHFNLTPAGGALHTMPAWPTLAWLCHHAIVHGGLYGVLHRSLNLLCRPLFALFAVAYPSEPRLGNTFDNMRLHAISEGQPRLSYVVRLVRRDVKFTRAAVERSLAQSSAVAPLAKMLLDRLGDDRDECAAHELGEWPRKPPKQPQGKAEGKAEGKREKESGDSAHENGGEVKEEGGAHRERDA